MHARGARGAWRGGHVARVRAWVRDDSALYMYPCVCVCVCVCVCACVRACVCVSYTHTLVTLRVTWRRNADLSVHGSRFGRCARLCFLHWSLCARAAFVCTVLRGRAVCPCQRFCFLRSCPLAFGFVCARIHRRWRRRRCARLHSYMSVHMNA